MNIERAVAADAPLIDELIELYPEAVDHETRSQLVWLAAPKPLDWDDIRAELAARHPKRTPEQRAASDLVVQLVRLHEVLTNTTGRQR